MLTLVLLPVAAAAGPPPASKAAAGAAGAACGTLFAAYEINHGQTVAQTLLYGVPAPMLWTLPGDSIGWASNGVALPGNRLAGCRPSAVVDVQNARRFDIGYAPAAGPVPLVTSVRPNTTAATAFAIAYEPQVAGHAGLTRRPTTVHVSWGGQLRVSRALSYDSLGRVTRVDTTTHNASSSALRRLLRPPLGARHPRSSSLNSGNLLNSGTHTSELFTYPRPHGGKHSWSGLQPTGYTVLGADGQPVSELRYTWRSSREDGLITDVVAAAFAPSSGCRPACSGAGESCCRDAGSSNGSGTCYSVAACEDLGGETWRFGYDEQGKLVMQNQTGSVFLHSFNSAGQVERSVAVGDDGTNTTVFGAVYDGGSEAVRRAMWLLLAPFEFTFE